MSEANDKPATSFNKCARNWSLSASLEWIDKHNGLLSATATVIIAILTLLSWRETRFQSELNGRNLKSLQDQIDISRTGERPWLKIDSIIIQEMHYLKPHDNTPRSLSLSATVKIVNIGKTVATAVAVGGVLLTTPENTGAWYEKAARNLLKQNLTRNSGDFRLNRVVFPNDKSAIDISADSRELIHIGGVNFSDQRNHLFAPTLIVGVSYKYFDRVGYTTYPMSFDGSLPSGELVFQTAVLEDGRAYIPDKDFITIQQWQDIEAE